MPGGFAIRVDNLGKKFIIGHQVEGDLRGSFSRRLSQLMGRASVGTREEFWALKDVSFEIEKGAAVGIIGRNGAGKSTLLKILSRITDPTTGRFEINGRVSSLLEVGTGFHPELTGRENIYLNGTILGMRRAEIRKKFDAIVDFSGVEKFLDTPVKHYSSGMKVRLAFSVAAHLEPEILIIDEVLAVGDAEFQKKCLGKMDEVSKGEGRTVLFVSHNMGAVRSLCRCGVLLDAGKVHTMGPTSVVIDKYLASDADDSIWYFNKPTHTGPGFLNSMTICTLEGAPLRSINPLEGYAIRVTLTILEPVRHFIVGIGMTTLEDYPIRTSWSKPQDITPGTYEVTFTDSVVQLRSGKYRLIVGLSSREQTFQYIPNAGIMKVDEVFEKDKVLRSNVGVLLNQMEVKIRQM
jgi:lipopolysaccharide transport system ATP-binding protein